MKKLVTRTQMKAIDSYSIEKIGIPSMVLMENAANEVVRIMEKKITPKDIILIVCGSGNNGGDGLAAARILSNSGYQVDVFFAGKRDQLTTESRQQLTIVENLDIVIWNSIDEINFSNYTILVDALFGIGLNRDIEGTFAQVIQQMNEHESYIYALDIPSGISADHAKVLGTAVKADVTITFGFAKIGQVLHPGNHYVGELKIVDIGFPPSALESIDSNYVSYDEYDLSHIPTRKQHSHKGSFGRVLIIAGSENMSGAAYLSAKAAYRTGAGLVEILSTDVNRIILQTQLPEAILTTYNPDQLEDKAEKEKIKKAIQRADAVVIGPGIGVTESSKQLLDITTLYLEKPTVFDADAINLIADFYNSFPLMRDHPYVRLNEFSHTLPPQSIITPHLKELARLMDKSVSYIEDQLLEVVDLCTTDSQLIYAIKDARTLVGYDQERYINNSGNSGMATAGSGDVLTGIIAGLLAQGTEPFQATKLAVYIHGLAGDYAAKQTSEYTMMASDIIEALDSILK
ncbi:NAD(P)H-hydrate dehydratase [Jeotgalibaca sp. MA1X17-3]|uniref:NAD(P)H-hydrate dehydratase n=1 Tax=Jeotgalibaca sp. MA1X17-3 TaxID=2908211 RepID=UPI001F29CB5A|nr:NAD(P)H-hydrate dehydratase [Jeotgalibaca sp. MA1X17-3]UJF16121.1 NAD(P)H-hydrate dehydratase [Jeotgalibaca sp. MA1X17-3]